MRNYINATNALNSTVLHRISVDRELFVIMVHDAIKEPVNLHCRDFVNIMQIYMVSHAIHSAKDTMFRSRLRELYGPDMSRVHNNFYLDALVTRLGCLELEKCANAGVHGAWEIGGELAGFPGREVSRMVHDDRVLKSCFMAQAIWVCADSNDKKNIVSMQILSGMPHPRLEINAPELLSPLSAVVDVLGACKHYIFVACPGFDKLLHMVHIADEAKYNEYYESGFTPFDRFVTKYHSLVQF